MIQRTRVDHVVIDTKTNIVQCKHCGEEKPLPLPMEIRELVKFTNEILEKHRACKAPEPKS